MLSEQFVLHSTQKVSNLHPSVCEMKGFWEKKNRRYTSELAKTIGEKFRNHSDC